VVRPHGAVVALGAVVVGLAILATGCGGESTNGVAQIGSTNSRASATSSGNASKPEDQPGDRVAYSACMRTHGVPNFPDPDSNGRIVISSGVGPNGQRTGIDNTTPQFKAAQSACQKLLPNGGRPTAAQQAQNQQAMLAFARCMRSHGVPNFPDPKADGELTMGSRSGVDPDTPQFKAAQGACRKVAPGSPVAAPPRRHQDGEDDTDASVSPDQEISKNDRFATRRNRDGTGVQEEVIESFRPVARSSP
jgi:hypothetical protein